jgi:hypothetical protein
MVMMSKAGLMESGSTMPRSDCGVLETRERRAEVSITRLSEKTGGLILDESDPYDEFRPVALC